MARPTSPRSDPRPATIVVVVKPGSKLARSEWDGDHMVIAVRERAVEGQANEAVRRTLADILDVAPSAITLRSGQASRQKKFTIHGLSDDEAIARVRAKVRPWQKRMSPSH